LSRLNTSSASSEVDLGPALTCGDGREEAQGEILAGPDLLEPGLTFRSQNVQVSQDFGELGFIDLMFEDADGRTLLVKVKVKADELDKAFSQILRQRHFFAQQNWRTPLFGLVSPVCSYHRFAVNSRATRHHLF
jgi:hypothetical protein